MALLDGVATVWCFYFQPPLQVFGTLQAEVSIVIDESSASGCYLKQLTVSKIIEHHQQGESQSLGCRQGIENVGNSPCDGTGKGLGHLKSNSYFCTQCFNPFLWQPGPMLGLISFCTHADDRNCAQR
ncbi:hypothetical protein Bbelb_104090 [Branchiostoma belcheri]|nr:hypothetical protein Bbelb_104090 [Branchiostoma belcheri]